MTTHRCLDVAGDYQGVVDWQAVEKELIRRYPMSDMPAGIAKLTEGVSFTDPHGVENIRNLKALDKIAVGYHALRSSDVPTQVVHYLSQAGQVDGHMVDWETFGSDAVSDKPGPDLCERFCLELHARDSRPIIVYTARWYTSQVGPPLPFTASLPLQLGNPHQTDLPPGWDHWTGWQYGGEANMPGVRSAIVDANILSDEWLALFNQTPTIKDTDMFMIKGDSDPAVYVVDGSGRKRHVDETTFNVLTANGIKLSVHPQSIVNMVADQVDGSPEMPVSLRLSGTFSGSANA